MSSFFKKIQDVFVYSIKGTLKTCLLLFKIMIPVSFLLIFLQETGWIIYVGKVLYPLMKPLGLPGEIGMVWATALLGNIFSGILVLETSLHQVSLSVAQMSVLSFIILIAHTLIIETTITYKAGMRIMPMILYRLLIAYGGGLFLHWIYTKTGVLQMPAAFHIPFPKGNTLSLGGKVIHELQRYGIMIIFIFALVFLMEFLKKFNLMKYINRCFNPFVKGIGIHVQMMPLLIIGMTLGLAYGGALIIKESSENNLSKKDIFYAIFLLAVFHSVIEDTILMLSIGGHYSSIILFRTVFAFLIMLSMVQLTKRGAGEKVIAFFCRK